MVFHDLLLRHQESINLNFTVIKDDKTPFDFIFDQENFKRRKISLIKKRNPN